MCSAAVTSIRLPCIVGYKMGSPKLIKGHSAVQRQLRAWNCLFIICFSIDISRIILAAKYSLFFSAFSAALSKRAKFCLDVEHSLLISPTNLWQDMNMPGANPHSYMQVHLNGAKQHQWLSGDQDVQHLMAACTCSHTPKPTQPCLRDLSSNTKVSLGPTKTLQLSIHNHLLSFQTPDIDMQ
jgi:hypothetical protein